MMDGLPKVIVSDDVKPGEIILVSGMGTYPANHPPKHIVAKDEDGHFIGFQDAAKITNCGGDQCR